MSNELEDIHTIVKLDDEYVEMLFKKIANEIVGLNNNADLSFVLEGFCGKDVSKIDMSGLSVENFKRLTFDSKTIFSEEQIKKFHPERLLEQGKTFSKGIERLHEKGIDGRGTAIGIIDSCFDSSIPEFKDKVIEHIIFEKKENADVVSYRNIKETDEDGHHGKTTASLVAGNECGVAPKSKLYLFGIASGTPWAEAKEAILKYIDNPENNINLDIISMSADTRNSKESQEILDRLDKKGCAFIDSSTFWKNFTWGRMNENEEVMLDELMGTMSKMNPDENSKSGKVLSNIQNATMIPCVGRTSIQVGKEQGYKYNGSVCGASFAIPQVAGLFSIARQMNPKIKFNEFLETIRETRSVNQDGMMYINPEQMVNKINERNITRDDIIKNNERINQLINAIMKDRRQKGLPFETDGKMEPDIKKIFEMETKKCLKTYEVEFDRKTYGDDSVKFAENGIGDLYGGKEGLQITHNLQEFLQQIYGITQGFKYEIIDGKISFTNMQNQGGREHDENVRISDDYKYIGSQKDQLDMFAYLETIKATDMDWVMGAIPHEAMHTFGVLNGNAIMVEGMTEELTREVAEKYHISMMPTAHTKEAEFVRKLEMIVGRDEIIEVCTSNDLEDPKRYEQIAKKFDEKLGLERGSFEKYIDILEGMYTLTTYGGNKFNIEFAREIYEKKFKDIDFEKLKWGKTEGFEEKVQKPLNELIENNPDIFPDMIESFDELMKPIDEFVKDKEIKIDDMPRNYDELYRYQLSELNELEYICEKNGIYISDRKEEKDTQDDSIIEYKPFTEQKIGKATINSKTEDKDKAQNMINNELIRQMNKKKTNDEILDLHD